MTTEPNTRQTEAQRVAYLIASHLRKHITKKERAELDQWVGASDSNMILYSALTDSVFLEDLTLNKGLIEAFLQQMK